MDLEFFPAAGARRAVFPHDTANPAPADRFARPSQRRLHLARAVATAARLVGRQRVGLDGVGRLRRVCPRAHGVVGRARNAEDVALRRYRAAAGVRRHRRRFRANIGAACFKASTSMRSLRFSRSSSMALAWSGVRLSAAWGDPVAFIDVIHLRTVDLPRSYSAMISPMGLPALRSSTICRLKSSLKCRGCLGSAMAFSVRNGPHGTVQLSVATHKPLSLGAPPLRGLPRPDDSAFRVRWAEWNLVNGRAVGAPIFVDVVNKLSLWRLLIDAESARRWGWCRCIA